MVVLCVVVLWGFSLLSVVVFFASSHFGFLLVLRFVNFSSLHENCGMRVLKKHRVVLPVQGRQASWPHPARRRGSICLELHGASERGTPEGMRQRGRGRRLRRRVPFVPYDD